MAISFTCDCGKKLRAPDEAAGKRSKCPACGQPTRVPTLDELAAAVLTDTIEPPPSEPTPPPKPVAKRRSPVADESEPAPPRRRLRPAADRASKAPVAATGSKPGLFHHFHWLFCLALLPLVISLLQTDTGQTASQRFDKAVSQLSPEQKQRLLGKYLQSASHADSEDSAADPADLKKDLLDMLPDHRLPGAWLPYDSGLHWLCAFAAAVLFLTFIVLMATEGVNPVHLLGIGLFTGTVGILLLLGVQWIADWTQGYVIVGRSVLVIFFWILKFIGFSYRAALGDTNFFLSFIGFTFGVGLCEELCKALPLLMHFRREPSLSWRGAMFWGLASGTGFGIAEGIMYSGAYYNGVEPAGTYTLRFLSCVALHALWTGSVALMIYKHHGLFHQAANGVEAVPPLFLVLGISMLLHGLYDTMLKKDMNALALVVALASFGWFAWQIHRLTVAEEADPESTLQRGLKTA